MRVPFSSQAMRAAALESRVRFECGLRAEARTAPSKQRVHAALCAGQPDTVETHAVWLIRILMSHLALPHPHPHPHPLVERLPKTVPEKCGIWLRSEGAGLRGRRVSCVRDRRIHVLGAMAASSSAPMAAPVRHNGAGVARRDAYHERPSVERTELEEVDVDDLLA
eukprot:1334559-Prymnesium_polylepis.1